MYYTVRTHTKNRPRYACSYRSGLSCLQVLTLVLSMLVTSAPPASAAPVQTAVDLTIVQVAAPDINCVFDTDCRVTVRDTSTNFTPPGASGSAFLQSRILPVGEKGTRAEGLYGYEYRVDLRNAVATTKLACVTEMTVNFGPVVQLDYDGDKKPDDIFVITKGGLGNVVPTRVRQAGTSLTFSFDPGICPGKTKGEGDSSFFFGLTSENPDQEVKAKVSGTEGLAESLSARAPVTESTEVPETGQIAYVFQDDQSMAAEFKKLLSQEGYGVDLITLENVLKTDLRVYKLVIIADDTGYLDKWGSEAAQAAHVAESGVDTLALGEGGYAFHGRLGLNIGWPNGWHGGTVKVVGDANLAYYRSPADMTALTDAPIALYDKDVNEVGIHLPTPVDGVTPIGREATSDTHYSLAAERGSEDKDRCHENWGFSGGPGSMTEAGRKLFLNAVYDTMNSCGGAVETPDPTPEPGCFEIYRADEVPAPSLIHFDDVADATNLATVYEASHGVTFEDREENNPITYSNRNSDPTTARSAPNVASNVPAGGYNSANVPLVIEFDRGKTHVGFYMGNGESAGLSGALVGYDRGGNVICQISNAPVPESYTEFIGMHDPAGRIYKVSLDYGNTPLSESIDDLLFAPSAGNEATATPTAEVTPEATETPEPTETSEPTETPEVTATPEPSATPPSARPERPLQNRKDQVRIEVQASDNQRFEAQFRFPGAQLIPMTDDENNQYVHFVVPGVANRYGSVGEPDVPRFQRLVAIPRGADVILKDARPKVAEQKTAKLYPVQLPAADGLAGQETSVPYPLDEPSGVPELDAAIFADPPFRINRDAYTRSEPLPSKPVEITHVGFLRDLEVVQISVAAGQYLPQSEELIIFESVDLSLEFQGGAEGFLPKARLDNPFERNGNEIYTQVLNAAILDRYVITDFVLPDFCVGHEYLIITDPLFRSAADTLRDWKVAKGISTAVVETGLDAGDAGLTKEAIRDFIKDRYENCWIRPAYVLLVGDAEFIPPFYRATVYTDAAGTDLDYSLMTDGDILPDLALGRLPVDTPEEAEAVVDKTIQYEQSPPISFNYYRNMSFAAYFQCCEGGAAAAGTADRAYVETAEFVRDELTSNGYSVERIYTTNAGDGNTPNFYNNGAGLPADLDAASGFAWDGETEDIVDAFNAGRSLVFHRDHGFSGGWSEPSLRTDDLEDLDNTQLPVVYSINCSTGYFDNESAAGGSEESVYFAEALLRLEGAGAVGIIGATRLSPSWANNALTRGLFDATWTDVLPGYGTDTSIRRLGDIMNYGKAYMASQIGVAQTAGSISSNESQTNYAIYHVFGDPTLELWVSYPWRVILPRLFDYDSVRPDLWRIRYPVAGTTITALQDGRPLARGTVVDGYVELQLLAELDTDKPVEFSASHPQAVDVRLHRVETKSDVTPEKGGEMAEQTGRLSIRFPANAISRTVTLLYTDIVSPTKETTRKVPNGRRIIHHFILEAEDEEGKEVDQFDKEYDMEVVYTDEELAAAGLKEDLLTLAFYNDEHSRWDFIETDVDTENNIALGKLDHFTEFALMSASEETTEQPSEEPNSQPEEVPSSDVGGENLYLPLVSQ